MLLNIKPAQLLHYRAQLYSRTYCNAKLRLCLCYSSFITAFSQQMADTIRAKIRKKSKQCTWP